MRYYIWNQLRCCLGDAQHADTATLLCSLPLSFSFSFSHTHAHTHASNEIKRLAACQDNPRAHKFLPFYLCEDVMRSPSSRQLNPLPEPKILTLILKPRPSTPKHSEDQSSLSSMYKRKHTQAQAPSTHVPEHCEHTIFEHSSFGTSGLK